MPTACLRASGNNRCSSARQQLCRTLGTPSTLLQLSHAARTVQEPLADNNDALPCLLTPPAGQPELMCLQGRSPALCQVLQEPLHLQLTGCIEVPGDRNTLPAAASRGMWRDAAGRVTW